MIKHVSSAFFRLKEQILEAVEKGRTTNKYVFGTYNIVQLSYYKPLYF